MSSANWRRLSIGFASLITVAGLLMILSCGGGSSTTPPQTITPPAQNVQSIAVNGGPVANQIYPNGAFTSVTICVPSTSTCQTIDGVLVDTGSYGLRLASSVVTLSLPQQTASDGNAVGECTQFGDGSYIWGPVATADIKMAGEQANAVPLHLLEDGFFTVPSDCSSGGGPEENNPASLGANGILGVGYFADDCGPACASGTSAPTAFYYECSTASGCVAAFVAEAKQVTNPVALFATDNNGVIVELPAVSGQAPSVTGSMVFGIGTQSNNGLGSATVLTLDANTGNITTVFKGTTYTNATFLDSGSNANFFLDSNTTGIAGCAVNTDFYCPPSPLNLSATNQGADGKTTTVNFSVGNADQLFSSTSNTAFSALAAPNPGSFDWGLPFFYGRNVFTAIAGKNTPSGPGPFWAY
jgi:Protein of unknown function (DUF3443)